MGVIKGDTRSLDDGSVDLPFLHSRHYTSYNELQINTT